MRSERAKAYPKMNGIKEHTRVTDALYAYHLSVRDLVNIFIKKYLDDVDEIKEYDYYRDVDWTSRRIGGTLSYADLWINFDDIVTDLKYSASQGLFEEWYWQTIDRAAEGQHVINYESYILGARYEDLEQPIK